MTDPGADPIRRLRHDLANPLSALMTEAEMLLIDETAHAPETVRALHEIVALARRMRDVLAESRQQG